ncbi:hypothetical protein PF005_g4751 [Phytophthora fragariae]|uniref:Uncharacterized protein n=1 Tax=Phytophthora fragariae TaxID=53985 RepID=A0A6A3T629_9STRA|nr:hypothetical protein PF003_g14386 [Phytophthora fragariae]KAE8945491.1 hypothetical protein PF009_g4857 [Phytophthora fragariae]KAE9008454.1 hypothetical protein PF011_g10701 [Phytophthora fragariae]KAE9130162.1 hypothetical protein PF010_g3925 [Phytophthora fragariae]KAE9130212.1 hypothetical protein PF007_g4613 [Phytophthora fragariae]
MLGLTKNNLPNAAPPSPFASQPLVAKSKKTPSDQASPRASTDNRGNRTGHTGSHEGSVTDSVTGSKEGSSTNDIGAGSCTNNMENSLTDNTGFGRQGGQPHGHQEHQHRQHGGQRQERHRRPASVRKQLREAMTL